MIRLSELTYGGLAKLAALRSGPKPVRTEAVELELVSSGLADRCDRGLKITGLGWLIIQDAQKAGLLKPDPTA